MRCLPADCSEMDLKDWAREGWESRHSVSWFQVFGAVRSDSIGGSSATKSQAVNLPPKREPESELREAHEGSVWLGPAGRRRFGTALESCHGQ